MVSPADLFDRPLFIVSSPRSGSTLLFETLRQAQDLFSIGGESHGVIEGMPEFSMPARNWDSNRLEAREARPELIARLAARFYSKLHDREGKAPQGTVRMLEKTPKNALRIPFFDAAFEEAHFVFLYRDVRQTLASMIEAWHSGYFRTYPRLPNWQGPPWSMLLPPDWRDWSGRPLPEVVANQWATTMTILIDDLNAVQQDRIRAIDYATFLAQPQQAMNAICAWAGFVWDRQLGDALPLSRTTVSLPDPEKWRKHEQAIEEIWPIVADADSLARAFLDRFRA